MNVQILKEIVSSYRQELILICISLIVIIVSLVFIVSFRPASSHAIVSSNIQKSKITTQTSVIVVDLAGAIESPDIYTMPLGSRLKELITLAGGLSDDADYLYVSKNINMASKLVDQQKIYIPFKNEMDQIGADNKTDGNIFGAININIATENELDTLPGIGTVTAQKIVDNRPYTSVEELLDEKILKTNVYEQVKEMITVQ